MNRGEIQTHVFQSFCLSQKSSERSVCLCTHAEALPGSQPLTPACLCTHGEALGGPPAPTPACLFVPGMALSRHPSADPGCWLTPNFPGVSGTRKGGRKGSTPIQQQLLHLNQHRMQTLLPSGVNNNLFLHPWLPEPCLSLGKLLWGHMKSP